MKDTDIGCRLPSGITVKKIELPPAILHDNGHVYTYINDRVITLPSVGVQMPLSAVTGNSPYATYNGTKQENYKCLGPSCAKWLYELASHGRRIYYGQEKDSKALKSILKENQKHGRIGEFLYTLLTMHNAYQNKPKPTFLEFKSFIDDIAKNRLDNSFTEPQEKIILDAIMNSDHVNRYAKKQFPVMLKQNNKDAYYNVHEIENFFSEERYKTEKDKKQQATFKIVGAFFTLVAVALLTTFMIITYTDIAVDQDLLKGLFPSMTALSVVSSGASFIIDSKLRERAINDRLNKVNILYEVHDPHKSYLSCNELDKECRANDKASAIPGDHTNRILAESQDKNTAATFIGIQ